MRRIYYKGTDGKVVRYACLQAQLDNKEARCVAFSGESGDNAVAAKLLGVVQPAAIEAALVAMQELSATLVHGDDGYPLDEDLRGWVWPGV